MLYQDAKLIELINVFAHISPNRKINKILKRTQHIEQRHYICDHGPVIVN